MLVKNRVWSRYTIQVILSTSELTRGVDSKVLIICVTLKCRGVSMGVTRQAAQVINTSGQLGGVENDLYSVMRTDLFLWVLILQAINAL